MCFIKGNEWLERYRDVGLLLFRLGLGGMFIWHGAPKVFGGPETWAALGKTMAVFGITFAPAFWGLMSGCAEFFGGILIVLGLFYRLACAFLIINLGVAFISQMIGDKGLMKASQSFEDAFSFLAALFIGPGKYSIDEKLGFNKRSEKLFSKY